MFHKYKSNCKWIKKHDMLFIKKLYIVIIVKSLVYAVITKQSTLSLSLLTEHPCQIHHSSLFMFYHPRRIRWIFFLSFLLKCYSNAAKKLFREVPPRNYATTNTKCTTYTSRTSSFSLSVPAYTCPLQLSVQSRPAPPCRWHSPCPTSASASSSWWPPWWLLGDSVSCTLRKLGADAEGWCEVLNSTEGSRRVKVQSLTRIGRCGRQESCPKREQHFFWKARWSHSVEEWRRARWSVRSDLDAVLLSIFGRLFESTSGDEL